VITKPLKPEVGERAESLRADVGGPDDGEAIDELRPKCLRVRGIVAQVLVAVVAATHLRHHRAVRLGQAGPRGSRHG